MTQPISEEFNTVLKDIGSLIKKIRLSKNLSELDVAKLSRVSESTVSDIENGKSRFNLLTVFKICETLEIKLPYVFGMYNADSKAIVKKMSYEIDKEINPYEPQSARAVKRPF